MHFCDNKTHKHTARMKAFFKTLDHILLTAAECWGAAAVVGRGEWAAGVFPGCLGRMGYVSLLLFGFSKDKFPLSSVEEFNHGI